ncbi:MAG: pyrroloquinoline quinone biosynthesis protein PqqB [Candidatus Eremiobacteraeota bacterium]|nr:pyrroloquinoline quinone biosynthesis protein PqqB [Candidatus Eremiobacteraeota bacterium]
MIVRVLGSAAGGGVPQWNCGCANCRAARAGVQPRRTQSSVAISADGLRWLLLNCSPDVATQIESFSPLHPRRERDTPIAGMLITDANVDHLGGLATLRQHGDAGFSLRSSGVVRAIAIAQPAFAPFAAAPHRWLEAPLDEPCEPDGADDLVGNQLTVRCFPVPGTTPGYDGRRRVRGAVVAYEISQVSNGRRLLFAPVFAELDDALTQAIASAHLAILDGTFYSDDEMVVQGLAAKRARSLGHQPVGGVDGTLSQLGGAAARTVFSHINNSNPLLDPGSAASACVRRSGAAVARDGMEFTL